MDKRDMGRVIFMVAVVSIMMAGVVMWAWLAMPKTIVAAVAIPGTTINSGESAIIYRFMVSAEDSDVELREIHLTFGGGASLENLHFYNDQNGVELSGALYYNSEGTIRYWPGWPLGEKIVIPEGTTKTFSLRGNVIGSGAAWVKLADLVIGAGSVEGLPSAIITLIVK